MSKNKKQNIYYRTAKWFCDRYATQDDIKYIALFLDMMVFQLFEMSIIFMTSSILGIILESFVFCLIFISFRIKHKGIHANTKLECIFWSTLMVISIAYIASITHIIVAVTLGIIMAIILRKSTWKNFIKK